MLKILHVIASVEMASGGPIEGLLRQVEATRRDCVCEIVSLDPPTRPELSRLSVKVHALGDGRPRSTLLGRWGYSPTFTPWLRAHSPLYDAIIVNGLWNYASFGASRALPGGPTPYFVFTHGMMDPWFRRTYPLKHMAKQLFWTIGEGRLLAGAESVLFTTEEERLLARGQFAGHRYGESVVGYGTSAPPPSTRAQARAFGAAAPEVGDQPYLLYLSRIHEKKGCDLLIEAFAFAARTQPALQLVIAGPGDPSLIARLQHLAAQSGVADRIHWPGMLAGDAKWGAFHGAEAFILTSHQENFGVAVAESLGCGKPVLISDKVNIWREVADAGAGLVRPDTLEGGIALISGWMAASPEQRQAMASAGRRLFTSAFDINQVAPTLIATIRAAL